MYNLRLFFITHGQMGELAETTPLLRVQVLTGFEGSNPSLSATFSFIFSNLFLKTIVFINVAVMS